MLVKVILLFLVAIMVLGMFGKLRLLKPWRGKPLGKGASTSKHCPACGRPRIGSGPCPCGKD